MKRPIAFHISPGRDESSVRSLCDRAVSAGFDGIELPLELSCSADGAGKEAGVGYSLSGLTSGDLKVVSVAAACGTCEIEPAIEEVCDLLQQAERLQARCLNLTIPPLRSGGDGLGFSRYQDALNFAFRLLHEARYEAESTGVPCALEVPADGCLLSPVETREVIDQGASWAVGACLDVRRIARIGSPADWLTTLGRRVNSLRVRITPEAGAGSVGTAEPEIGFASLWAVLDEVSFEGPMIDFGPDEPEKVWAELAGTLLARP
jgi:sugar phosphate isomerase/epimerase